MSVTRYKANYDLADMSILLNGWYVKASDYDALLSVCRELEEENRKLKAAVSRFIEKRRNLMKAIRQLGYEVIIRDNQVTTWPIKDEDKALSRLDGEKNEGVR